MVRDEVYFGLQGETTGWVALGLEPTRAMQDADMLLGWEDGDRASVPDAFSEGGFGPIPRTPISEVAPISLAPPAPKGME